MTMVTRLTKALVVFAAALALVACGGGGDDGPPPSVPQIPGGTTGGAVGTAQNPVPVSVGPVHQTSVGVFTDSYYTFVAPTTGSYLITLSNPTIEVGWELFPDKTYSISNRIQSCSSYAGSTCMANLTGGAAYYLKVDGWAMSTTSGSFELQIKLVTNEGSTSVPVNLSIGVPHVGSVGISGASYYQFTPATAGAHSVAIAFKGGSWAVSSMTIYAGGFNTVALVSCGVWPVPVCTANGLAAGVPYYVEIKGDASTAASYSIEVTQGVSQGTEANPVVLAVDAANAHAGAVDANSSSYYKFTTGSSGEYLVNYSGGSIYAAVSPNADFSGESVACSNGVCQLRELAASTPYYVRVHTTASTDQTFLIAVKRGFTEGSAGQPLALSIDIPHGATISGYQTAYYSFQTTSFAGSYTISLTGTQADLRWFIYPISNVNELISKCDTSASVVDERCPSANLEPNTTYLLAVNNQSSTASSYTLGVTVGGGSEGTPMHPVDLGTVSPSGLIYANGQVRYQGASGIYSYLEYGRSYYKFTTGPSPAVHVISQLNGQGDLSWDLGDSPSFWSYFQTCNEYTTTVDEVCSTQTASAGYPDPMPGQLKANTTYYLSVSNKSSTSSTFKLGITPLVAAAGCVGSYSECLDFETGLPVITQTSTQMGTKWQWRLDSTTSAGPGLNHLVSGAVDYPYSGCFSYTPAVRPSVVSFSFLTESRSVEISVQEAGVGVKYASDYTYGVWKRNTYRLPVGTMPLTFTWCMKGDSVTSGLVRLDDIQFE